MKSLNPHAASDPDPGPIAWAISAVVHVSAILLLALAASDVRREGAGIASDAADIVLTLAPTDDEHDNLDEAPTDPVAVEGTPAPESIARDANENLADEAAPEAPRAPHELLMADTAPPVNVPPPASHQSAASSDAASLPATSIFAADVGRRPAPAGRGYAHVRVFGVEGRGNKFVYVFDRSSSMEGPPLAAAKSQLVQSLAALTGVHQFHIIFFNHELQPLNIAGGARRLAFGSDRDKQLAANFVGGITAWGGTDRYAALKAALAFRPDVVFFLTDADDPMADYELEEILHDSERAGSMICVIEFGRDRAPNSENFLQALARRTGGQYGYINTARLGW